VLEQLDGVKGVAKSWVNHDGTLIKLALESDANHPLVRKEIERLLKEQKRSPRFIEKGERSEMLTSETWREHDQVHELSAIESRELALRFAEEQGLSADDHQKLEQEIPASKRHLESSTEAAPEEPTTLTDISNITELQELFNRDQRKPRLILLLSPT